MTDDQRQPLNREQRRARKFRRQSTARQDNLYTQRQNNTGFLATPTDSLADGPRDMSVTGSVEALADPAASPVDPAAAPDDSAKVAPEEP